MAERRFKSPPCHARAHCLVPDLAPGAEELEVVSGPASAEESGSEEAWEWELELVSVSASESDLVLVLVLELVSDLEVGRASALEWGSELALAPGLVLELVKIRGLRRAQDHRYDEWQQSQPQRRRRLQ